MNKKKQKNLIESKYKRHQETKQDRLEELSRKKIISGKYYR